MKRCCRCGDEKSVTEFYRRSVAADGLSHACKTCLAECRRKRRAMTEADRLAEVDALRGSTEKRCGKCGETKLRADFGKSKASRDGMRPWCKGCISDYARAHYEANREKRSEQAAAWYGQNKERRDVQRRAWNEANRDRLRAHNYERSKKWRRDNPERWAELLRRGQQARRAREVGALVGTIDFDLLWTGCCGICGDEIDLDLAYPHPLSRSLDHIIPLSRGGTHKQDNLQYAHLRCNIRKGARVVEGVA